MSNEIKVGDRFEDVELSNLGVCVVTANNGNWHTLKTASGGPLEQYDRILLNPQHWRRIPPTKVEGPRVGQVWRREQDSQKFRLTSKHRHGWWNAVSLDADGESGYFLEKDGTLPHMYLVTDAQQADEHKAVQAVQAGERIHKALENWMREHGGVSTGRTPSAPAVKPHCFGCKKPGEYPQRVIRWVAGEPAVKCTVCEPCYLRNDQHDAQLTKRTLSSINAAERPEPPYEPRWTRTGVQTYSRRVPKPTV